MGACCATQTKSPEDIKREREEKIRSKWLNDVIKGAQEQAKNQIKLLFLGAGESGKSTLLKQMTIINGTGFSDEEKKNYIPLIHSNILQSMKMLLKMSKVFAQQSSDSKFLLIKANEEARDSILELKFDDMLTERCANYVQALWVDPAIQITFAQRSQFQLNDSTQYFFDRLPQIIKQGYMPDEQDVLRARIRTTGIVEHVFTIDNNQFRMFDVGGQRNARKKWIHCFQNVTSVIFVAALSGYDEKLFEEESVNKLHEALNLFEDIINSKWFKDSSMILFLNKKDIFKEKITRVPLTVCFPYYNGANEYREGLKFVRAEFLARNHHEDKKVFTHFTCATDTTNIRHVFTYVKATILRTHLIDIGLMDAKTDLNPEPHNAEDELKDEDLDE